MNALPTWRADKPFAVVFCAHYLPHLGGVEVYTHNLWQRIAKTGRHIHICTCSPEHAPLVETLGNMTVWRFPARSVLGGQFPFLQNCRAYREYTRWLRHNKPKFIVTNTRFFEPSWVGTALAQQLQVPHLHIEHGSDHVFTGKLMVDCAARIVDYTLGRHVLQTATQCVGVSQRAKEFVERFAGRECGELFNAVDTDYFSPGESKFRKEIGISNEPIVAFVGRLVPEKGVLDLLHAWDSLGKPRARLILAGVGPLEAALRVFASWRHNVSVVGKLSREGIRSLLRAASILVHPSRCAEGLPTVLLEAGAIGLCVIASNRGGTSEVIPTSAYGYLFEAGDIGSLAWCLSAALDDPAGREEMGIMLQRHVRANFDWNRRAEEALRLLDEISFWRVFEKLKAA